MERDPQLLEAARVAVAEGTSLEDFMSQAWNAFMDARPGLREQLVDRALRQQLAALRTSGKIATA